MKRLFPRAVPDALIALLVLGEACSPSSNVKPGAPVLTMLSIVDPSGNKVSVTPTTTNCPAGLTEGMDCDPTDATLQPCELGANIVCTCVAKDMCDPTITDAGMTQGKLNCTYPAQSTVIATFDRLIDTAPFEPATMASVATLTGTPATTATLTADYNSAGSPTGLLFTMAFGITGPTITLTPAPALPTSDTVTIALIPSTVQAKDGKTPFAGDQLLADGTIAFKTPPFSASITTPAPMSSATAPSCAAPMMDAGADDGGSADGGVDAAEAGASDAGAAVAAAATDVPASMNTGAITIAFSNPVGADVLGHITMTEDGQPFTGFVMPAASTFPTASVSIAPATTWAAGKTYAITVDAAAADVLGAKLGQPASAAFTMSAN